MSLPIVACALLLTALASSQFVDGCYTSIFAFGDSFSDTGNYISLTSNGLLQYDGIPSCSVPPYGETFFHHPTGRCSDGRVIIDFIAEQFGLPLVPPYSGGRKANRGGGGVNFAVVGAPALTEDVLQSNGSYSRDNISMMSQINMFKSLLQSICKTSSCDEIFDKSLIVFGPFGGDDYASAILSKRVEDALRLQPLVINAVASGIEKLKFSARNSAQSQLLSFSRLTASIPVEVAERRCEIRSSGMAELSRNSRLCSSKSEENMSTLVADPKLIGRATADLKVAPQLQTAVEEARSLKSSPPLLELLLSKLEARHKEDYDPITGCLTWLNEFAQKHNGLLRKELTRIQELYPNVSITYADYYNAGLELFLSPKKYGFNDESRLIACCGSGGPYNVDDDAKCGYPSSHACDDPSSYIQWDGAHLTQAAYQWIAKGLLSGLYTSPNITASCSSTSAKWI
nr:sinapine esterase-like [Ipomoea batatas]